MKIIQIILLVSAALLTTEAVLFKKLITSYGPSVQSQNQILHSEPQAVPSPLEPAPVFENTGEVNPALLPPPSLFSIQPVTRYVLAPTVLSHPFYSLPLLHGATYATADASAGTSAFLYHPEQTQLQAFNAARQQAAYDSALRYAATSGDIQNQRLIDEAQRQEAFYAAAQSQSNAIVNSGQQTLQLPQKQYGPPQQTIDAEAQAQSNAATNAGLSSQSFIQSQFGPPQPADTQPQTNAAFQQQSIASQNHFSPQETSFNNVESQNFNSAAQGNIAAANIQSQQAQNQYEPSQSQSSSLQNFHTAQSSGAASSATASSGQSQQLFTPSASSEQNQHHFLPYSATSSASASTASAHSSSVSTRPVSSIASHISSFATSSSSSSSSNLITPYTVSSSSSSAAANVASANVADNLIIPSASYGPPQ